MDHVTKDITTLAHCEQWNVRATWKNWSAPGSPRRRGSAPLVFHATLISMG